MDEQTAPRISEDQMRQFLRIPPVERIRMMLEKAATVKDAFRDKLREAHPELDDLSLTRMVFEELDRDDKLIYFWPPNSTE